MTKLAPVPGAVGAAVYDPAVANPSETLTDLARAVLVTGVEATSVPYTAEGWKPWREAAESFQAAVTVEAAAAGVNRYELEMAAKQAARKPAVGGE